MKNPLLPLLGFLAAILPGRAQETFNGLGTDLTNLYRLADVQTHSISPENPTGGKGAGGAATAGTGAQSARDLGQGWKVNPCVFIAPGQTFTLCEIDGPGAVQHIWMTPTGNWRLSILRIYWDGEKDPSVETPVGDFFGMGWGKYAPLSSLAVCVNPGSAFNCYWPMPFRRKCRITMENLDDKPARLFYQIDYALGQVPADAAYLHAQFRRTNPLPLKSDYVILDGVQGKGQYVGLYLAICPYNNGWWGEGEIKFFIDGDGKFPTICGTGTEDYFCGSYDFDTTTANAAGVERTNFTPYCTPYSGLHQVILGDGHYAAMQRYGMYRWHIHDPIRFDHDLKVTIQALGWKSGHRYLPLQCDIASVAFWYQAGPHAKYPALPGKDELEIN
jgi:hypothetical protein